MKRLAWLTDIHLNFVNRDTVHDLCREVLAASPDAVLIGGDVGTALNVSPLLERLAELLKLPIYFVLGNHDFYHGSIDAVRAEATSLMLQSQGLSWLPIAGVVSLTSQTALIGHDGWGDGGFGNATGSPVKLNDFRLIEELRKPSHEALLEELRRLGLEAAEHFRTVLARALDNHEQVYVLTHVPPFREAAWHEGKESGENWLPYFACRAAGEVLREFMASYPQRKMTVLCGHTHSSGMCQVLTNLTVFTGAAEYRKPRLQRVIEIH